MDVLTALTQPEDFPNLPDSMRSVLRDDDGEIWMPVEIVGWQGQICAIYDGAPTMEFRGAYYLPGKWLRDYASEMCGNKTQHEEGVTLNHLLDIVQDRWDESDDSELGDK